MSNRGFGRGTGICLALALLLTLAAGDAAHAGGSWGSSRGGFGGGGLLGGFTPVRSLLGGVSSGVRNVGSRLSGLGSIGSRSLAGGGSSGFGGGGSTGFGGGSGFSGGCSGFGGGGFSGGSSGFSVGSGGGLLGLGIAPRVRNLAGGLLSGAGGLLSGAGRLLSGTGGLSSTGGWGSSGGLAYSGGLADSFPAADYSAPIYDSGLALDYAAPATTPTYAVPSYAAPVYAAPVYAAPAISYGCTGGLYSGSATADYYGDWGMNYLQGPAFSSLNSAIAIDSYDISPYNQTGLEFDSIEAVYGAGIGSGLSYDTSAITGNSLIDSSFISSAPLSMETGFSAPMLDYGAVPTLPSEGIALPQLGDQLISTPDAGTTFGPVDGLSSPSFDGGFGAGLPEAPSPDAEDEDINSTRQSTQKPKVELASISLRRWAPRPTLTRAGISEAVLALSLPQDAKVYINGKLTATKGTLREYVSRKLKSGKSYSYQVKAVVERNAARIVRSKLVRIKTGTSQLVEFDFIRPQVTKLVLKVPADAEVLLDGQKTNATGDVRVFSTGKLTNEQSWKDYHVEVRYQVAGKQVVREQSLTLTAGATEVLEFGTGSQISGEQVASK